MNKKAALHPGMDSRLRGNYKSPQLQPAPGQIQKMTTLMQFARRAGKLISGYDACLRAMHHRKLYLVLIAEDTAPRTCRGIEQALNENQIAIPLLRAGNQTDLSQALGLPKSGVFGIGDKQFASAIQACVGMDQRREEPCK